MGYPYAGPEFLTEGGSHDWEEAWAYFHRREEEMMLEDFKTACQGHAAICPGDPTNLDWLASILAELRQQKWPDIQDDPSACWEALARSEAMLRGLREAMAAALATPSPTPPPPGR